MLIASQIREKKRVKERVREDKIGSIVKKKIRGIKRLMTWHMMSV